MTRFSKFRNAALSLGTHLRGWKSRQNIVVIESDDWGAIRMPSQSARASLRQSGLDIDGSPYNRLDCLERKQDFEALMNVLYRHRDEAGSPAKFTLNAVMGNPDFQAIQGDSFSAYHHQHFFDSYRDYHGQNLEMVWHAAIDEGLIQPQFHGREHLNVTLWLRDLQDGHLETRRAFEHRFYGLRTKTSSKHQVNYLAAFWAESKEELESARCRLDAGLKMFHESFGFSSRTFIACNYVFPQELESTLTEAGVILMQGQRGQILPRPDSGDFSVRRSYIGKRESSGLVRTIRNVQFEPYRDESSCWPDMAIRQISSAFLFRKPAIITSHRINYSGGLSEAHRDRCLRMLDELLTKIRKRWPDVVFLSSDQLADEIQYDV